MAKDCREARVGVLLLGLLVLFSAAGLPSRCAAAAKAGYSGPLAVGERVSPERLRGTIELFSSFQSRVPGTPGSRRAGDFIIERLKGLGLEAVAEQTFPIMAPVDRGSRLSLEKSSSVADVYGFWPNLVRLPTTPGGGTRGPLLYAGTGRFSEFNDVPSDLWDQAIVLMDFDCSMRWLNAAMMGAAAVGFIEDTSAPRRQAVDKCLKVPLDLPRFLIRRGELAEFLARSGRPDLAGATAENLEEVLPLLNGLKVPGRKAFRKPLSAHLEIDMGWEEVQCRNITARLPGRDPALRAEEVILQAHYDSISCTPKLAPGAENACGAAALLEMARVFKEARPRRSCVFLFTDAHFQALAGMRHYVYELYREEQARLAKAGLIASARERQERSTLLISLDLASHSPEVGLFFKGHFYDQQAIAGEERFTSKFIDIANAFDEQLEHLKAEVRPGAGDERGARPSPGLRRGPSEASAKEGALPWGIEFANTIRAKKGLDWRTFVPERIALDSEVYSLDTRPGIALCTTRDARTWVDTPWDTPYVEGPEGRRERVDFARLSRQVKFITELLGRCLSGEELPAYRLGSATALSFVYSDTFCKVVEDTLLSYLPTTSVDDALVACELNTAFSMRGVRGTAYLRSGADGRFLVAGLPSGQNRKMWSFRTDPEDGRITFVSNTAQGEGSAQAVVKGEAKDRPEPWLKRPTDRRFSVFQCVPLAVFDLIDQLSFRPLTTLSVLEARSNGPPRNHTVFTGDGPAIVVFTKRSEGPVKLLLSSARLSGRRMALLNSDASKPEGEGFSFKETGGLIRWTALQAARDMWQLNEERIRRLERYGIKNARVRELHRWSEEARLEAEQELAEASISDFRAHVEAGEEPGIRYDYVIDRSRTAWALEAKAYPEVRSTTNDVVKGLIFYFALLLPFTFFAERLFFSENERVPRWIMWVLLAGELAWLIPAWLVEWAVAGEGLDPVTRAVSGTVVAAVVAVSALILEKTLFRYRDIRAQLGHMGLIFTVVYLVLVLVHPAFKISKTPSVILIGFFMLMLAVIVTGLLLSRFGQQLRAARESANLAHREDVSRGGAAVVAFTLGVQNMRKRPIRTLLTSLTLILLMFTILSFVTFQQQTMYSVNAVGKRPAYEGLLIRYADWGSMQRYAGYTVVDYFKNMGATATRSWLVSEDPKRALHIAIESVIEKSNEKPEGPNRGPPRTYSVAGILGLEGAEAKVSGIRKVVASAGDAFAEGEWDGRDVCLLPERAAEHLGGPDGAPAGHVRIFGRKFRVVGVIREGQLTDLKDLDGEGVTPVDYVRTAERRAQQQQQQQQQITEFGEQARRAQIIQQFDHLAQERVVVMPRDVAERYGAAPRSIAFAPREPGELEKIVRNYANRSGLILFAGIGPDRFLYSTFGWLSVRGLTNLAVPFAIAALMVFNVMIGSVYERTREINIFASVGLAPLHIGSLFLAESAVYASVGAIFGYLLGQVVAKITTTTDLFAGMTVNYSSTSAVVATAFVGGVVLLSTVFPAKKAADMSVPDETRKITLPRPVGDVWEFEFPFTVSTADALGLNVFLHDYFSSQDEDSTGRFSASEVSLKRLGEGHFRLSAKTWLMPLDMGISQSISFETRPTGYEESISEFFVRIERLSGEVAAWRRMNMGFFVTVRKQFLIWRLVESDSKAEYRARGESMLGLAPGEAPAAAPGAEKAAPEAEPEKKEAEEAPARRKPLPVALAVAAFLAAAALEFGLWGYSGLWGTVSGLPQAVVALLVGLVAGTLSVGLLKDRAFACAWAGRAAWVGVAASLLLGAVFLIMAMAPGLGELAPGESVGLYMGRRVGQAALQALRAAFFVGAAFALSRTAAREFLRSHLEPEAAK